MSKVREKELSRRWKSDESREERDPDAEETKRIIEEVRAANSFAKSNSEEVGDLDSALFRADLWLRGVNPDTMRPFDGFIEDPNVELPDPDPHENSRLIESRDKNREVIDNTAEAAEPEKNSTLRRWLYVTIGLLVAGGLGGTIYELIRRNAKGEGSSDLDVPEEVRDAIQKLMDKWSKASDDAYWNDFAVAVDAGLVVDGKNESFTIADQLIFLNLTIATNPLQDIWSWDSASDNEANAEAIKKFYDASGKVSDIYRHVLEVKYKDQVMPRAIAATQLQTVLGWILAEKGE